jgi:hypothetical protein
MSDLFGPIEEAARETLRAANALATTPPDPGGRRPLVDNAAQQLRLLEAAVDRRLALGLAFPLTSYWRDGSAGWEHDARAALRDLLEDAAALVGAAAAVPPRPALAPGEEWTAAAEQQAAAHLQARQDVATIGNRLRHLMEVRLFELARVVDASAAAAPGAGPPPVKGGPARPAPDDEGRPPAGVGLELIAGGFAYRGRAHELTGNPLTVLRELLASRYRRRLRSDLANVLFPPNEKFVAYPEQAVRDAATELRAALRAAVKASGVSCDDPLPCKGKGADCAYFLTIP